MQKHLLLFILTCFSIACFSQAGQLDPLYDRDGIQSTSFLKGNVHSENGQKLLQQADGKILAIFSLSFSQGVIGRYLSNGALDVSYGSGGFTPIMDVGFTDAVLQSDGKVVAAGNGFTIDGDYGVVRFKTNGQPDSSFGSNGKQITDFGFYEQAYGIAIQNNGKIVVVGSAGTDFGVVRYNTNGSLDNTFSTDGKQVTNFGFYDEARGVAIQTDGKIVVTGMVAGNDQADFLDFGLARYNTNGILDNTFSGDGKHTTNFGFDDYGDAVVIQTDGKIVVAGTAFVSNDFVSKGNFAIARYTTNGSPDNTFSGDGRQTTDLYGEHDAAFAIALQTDGKLLVAGISADAGPNFNYGLVRYNSNGNLDPGFSGDGKQKMDFGVYDAAHSVLFQADGKILLAGEVFNDSDYDLGLVRYTSTGTPDAAFSTDGLVISFLPTDAPVLYTCAAVQPDGKLVVAGYVQHKIAGSPGNRDFAIARYHPNGLLDNSFDLNGKLTTNFGSNDVAFAIAIQSNGKILVAGGSNGRFVVSRYNPDGSFDNTFNGNGKVLTTFASFAFVTSMAIQADGRIVVAGGIFNASTGSDFAVVRYNSSGVLDNTFSGDGKLATHFGHDDVANALALQKDGKILAVGSSQDSSLTTYFALARYNTNGSPDPTFSGDGRQVRNFLVGWQNDASSVALQGDGKIVVAGALRTELGTSFLLARYNTNGNLDNTYSGDGIFYFEISEQSSANSVVVQADGKSVVGGFANGSHLALARVRLDGTLDPSFGSGGKQVTAIPLHPAHIHQIVLSGHRLYAAGGYIYSATQGVTAAYQLGSFAVTLTCPTSRTVPPDPGTCVATVRGIDPSISPVSGAFTVNYSLSGATIGSGAGTASGRIFNNGNTTVTYRLKEAPEKTCSFMVTVNCAAMMLGKISKANDVADVSPDAFVVRVLPNPAYNYFTLNTKSNRDGMVQIRVTDMVGKLIELRSNIAANGSIEIGHRYRPGAYFIQVTQGKETIVIRCIKQAP